MLFALVLSVVGAAPTLASPDFSTLNVSGEVARFCNEHLAQQLATRGVQVTTARQISAALGLERQKQLLGCGEDASSCIAELASALGVDGMVLGDLGRLGTKFQVNLRVTRSSDGKVIATWSRSVNREDDLLEALTDAAQELAPAIFSAFNRAVPTAPVVKRTWPLAPTLIGGGLAAVSLGSFIFAGATYGRLTDENNRPGTISPSEEAMLKSQGEVTQWISIGALIGAGVSLGVCIVMYVLSGHETPVQAALTPWLGSLGGAQR